MSVRFLQRLSSEQDSFLTRFVHHAHTYRALQKSDGHPGISWLIRQGLVIKGVVHAAGLQDRESVPLLLEPIKGVFPRMKKVWVDQGSTGKECEWIEQEMQWDIEVVHHPRRGRGE